MSNRKTPLAHLKWVAPSFLLLAAAFPAQADVTITRGSGGSALSADTAANSPTPSWTSLGRITIAEPSSSRGDFLQGGTLVLKAPAGFEFNTAVTPNVTFTAGRDITSANAVVTDATTLTITININGTDSTDVLNIGPTTGLQVRPTAAAPLASGSIRRPATDGGTAVITGITATDSFADLASVAGSAHRLSLETTLSAAVAAGQPLSPAPVIHVQDQFGNLRSQDNSSVIAARLINDAPGLFGATNVTALGGVATFSNLSIRKTGPTALMFTSGALEATVSGNINVGPGPASTLSFSTQPGSSVYGLPLDPQPVVMFQDQFGNVSSIGLPSSLEVTLSLSAGTGSAIGTTFVDAGTAAGNGVAVFSGVLCSAAGSGKRLTAWAEGFSTVQSAPFSVTPATVNGSVTVANKAYDATTSATILARNLTGVLGSDAVALSGGTANFADGFVGTNKTVTITNLSLSGAQAANYQLASTSANASADIRKAPLTVTAANQSRPYGASNVLTASYSGFAGSETLATSGVSGSPSLTTTALATSSPGVYPISIAVGTLTSLNYEFNLAPGQLTVTKAPLIVGADSKWKTSGTPNPALTYSFSGFVNGDTPGVVSGTPSLSTTATTGSAQGAYPISLSLGSLSSPNYNFSPVNGTLTVVPPGTLFYDGFARITDPGALTPWLVQTGAWSIANGVLQGTNTFFRYSFAHLTNQWNDYTVQGRFAFGPGAFGGGLSGRLNPATGERYAAWIYPENSTSGLSNVVRLLKFRNWTDFGYGSNSAVAIAQTSVPAVGTTARNLMLVFHGSEIAVFYDGQRVITTIDGEPAPLLEGSIGVEMWTDTFAYQMQVDDIRVGAWSGPVAGDDAYNTTVGAVLSVPAPGVLLDDLAAGTNITAALVNNVTNGSLSFAASGAFTYIPAGTSAGSDRFTYRVQDGTVQSAVATVLINIGANTAPTARADTFTVPQNTALVMGTPGVLANDSDPDGQTLKATLVSGPSVGSLTLNTNGAFTYLPPYDYTGNASFVYRANDGVANSANATVTISVTSAGTLLSEDFARTNDPGALAPWFVRSGAWTITDGLLKGGTNVGNSYGSLFVTNNWTDYTAEARVQFPAGAYGGGVGARLNPVTGEQYAAWLYPENSPGGSNVIKLLKFTGWNSFGYSNVLGAAMRQVSIPAVGTGWHTLKLVCYERRIAVYYDGRQVINTVDTEPQPHASGGACLQFWTDATPYQPVFDNVLVQPWRGPLASNDVFSVAAGSGFTIQAPGLLANDLAAGTNLAAVLVTPPARGDFTLKSDGGFTYLATNNFSGTDTFTYRLNDGLENSGTATVTLNVGANTAPTALNDSYSVRQGSTLTVASPGVLANDSDANAQPLTAVLISAPAQGVLELKADGSLTYTPAAAFIGTDTFTYRASDGIATSVSATVTLNVLANRAPVAAADSYSLAGNTVLSIAPPGVLANDSDPDAQPLQALLISAPAQGSLTLATNGGLTYIPPAGFIGSATFTYRANDGISNSALTTVSLTVTAPATPLFSDNFSRTNDPGSLSPWLLHSGAWSATGGSLRAGANANQAYGYVYHTTLWSDFTIEARLRFETGAYGGGIGGRLNPANGAHYAAWVYPAGSSGGSNVVKLIKFSSWWVFGYTNASFIPMSEASVASVGTDWHTLKLQFTGSQIAVYYDGAQVISMTDTEPQPHTFGSVNLGMWTDATAYSMFFEDVVVSIPGGEPAPCTGAIARTGNNVAVTFTGAPNTLYILQSASSLASPVNWAPVATNISAADGKWTYSTSATGPSRFYRAVKP